MTIEWNKVTWYSKLAAVILFVGTFFLGFWLGTMKAEKIYVEVPHIIHRTSYTPTESNAVITAHEDVSVSSSSLQKQIGYIKRIYARDGQKYIDIDYIQWITGKEAAGYPDGYVIRNTNPAVRTFKVQSNITVQLADLSYFPESVIHGDAGVPESYKVSWLTFEKIFAISVDAHYHRAPYWISISSDNEVNSVEEQVIP